MSEKLFKNTGKSASFYLKKDRFRITVWLIALAGLTFVTALAFTDLYQNEQERQAIADTMHNPAMTAMVGQGYGLDNYTTGAMMAHQMLLFTAVTVAIMSILLLVRSTRADEEAGRVELIRSLPSGRLAPTTAAVMVLFMVNLLVALVIGLGLYSLRIESMDLEGSLLYGAALGATGIFFTSLTAVFSQLLNNSRGVIGFSFAVLGLSYLIRAIGDVGNQTLSWASPLGWILGTEVYVTNYWWPVIVTLVISIILFVVALYLQAIRDIGAGFFPERPGKSRGSGSLLSPLGLAFRLQRVSLITWGVGMFVLGVSYGSVLGDLEAFIEGIEMMEEMLPSIEGFTLTEQFITMLMAIMAMISTIPALMAVLKIVSEEKKNRIDHILSRSVSRNTLLGSYLLISVIVSFVMMSLAVTGLWIAGNISMEEGLAFGTLYSAGMVYLPAIWLMVSIAVLLIGKAPNAVSAVWGYLLYSFIVVYLGGLLQFEEWLSVLSPYGHVPQLPVEDVNVTALATLTFLTLLCLGAGYIAYNKRDIHG